MIRKIIHIDEKKCNGCSLCADACHEGAIAMVDGKAKLIRDDYCDGLGNCLPVCPTGAISFEMREAAEYDEEAVQEHQNKRMNEKNINTQMGGCKGSQVKIFNRENNVYSEKKESSQQKGLIGGQVSQLMQWPVQIKLVPINAAYFNKAKLLIAADCTAYAYANFHKDFMRGKVTLIGCPKLDEIDYSEKLTQIIKNNDIQSLTIVRMEVPCCGGIEFAAKKALQASGKFIPWQVVTISTDGDILD
nr:4Fe-4S binding protein [uncultured Criibacterium sp.]